LSGDPDSLGPDRNSPDPVLKLLGQHDKELVELATRLDNMGSPAAGQPANWNWRARSSTEVAKAAVELAAWAAWLVGRYELRELPSCWYLHGAMVEELIALHAAHVGAYSDSARPYEPLVWHEGLERWRSRMHSWDLRGCGGSPTHKEGGPAVVLEMPPETIDVLVAEATKPGASTPGRPQPPAPPGPQRR